MNNNNNWCAVCRMPIQSKPHDHCEKCGAMLARSIDAASRWYHEDIIKINCSCGYKKSGFESEFNK